PSARRVSDSKLRPVPKCGSSVSGNLPHVSDRQHSPNSCLRRFHTAYWETVSCSDARGPENLQSQSALWTMSAAQEFRSRVGGGGIAGLEAVSGTRLGLAQYEHP